MDIIQSSSSEICSVTANSAIGETEGRRFSDPSGLAESTVERYKSAWESFARYCVERKLPYLPTRQRTIDEYIAARNFSPSNIAHLRAAIAWYHARHQFDRHLVEDAEAEHREKLSLIIRTMPVPTMKDIRDRALLAFAWRDKTLQDVPKFLMDTPLEFDGLPEPAVQAIREWCLVRTRSYRPFQQRSVFRPWLFVRFSGMGLPLRDPLSLIDARFIVKTRMR